MVWPQKFGKMKNVVYSSNKTIEDLELEDNIKNLWNYKYQNNNKYSLSIIKL